MAHASYPFDGNISKQHNYYLAGVQHNYYLAGVQHNYYLAGVQQ